METEPRGDRELRRDPRALQHPPLWQALRADARMALIHRGERHEPRSRLDALVQVLRLMVVTDAFFAQSCYRVEARLRSLRIPIVPWFAHRAAMLFGQVVIGQPVVIAPGLHLYHGNVVIDGRTTIGPSARIAPFVTIGLKEGCFDGPSIGANVSIGTGAKVLGPVEVGTGATIGANAVVVSDVPPRAVAVGVPARTLPR